MTPASESENMFEEQIVEAIKGIDEMIDKINDLNQKKSLTDLEVRMIKGYSTKYQLWLLGMRLNGLTTQEYCDNYHLFEKNQNPLSSEAEDSVDSTDATVVKA